MTSSPLEEIEKALEGAELAQRECVFAAQEARKANGADTYPARVLDKAAGVIEALALQLEAMKREMAEKDERIAALEARLKPFAEEAACYDPDTGDGDDSVWATPAYFKIRDLRRARALLTKENPDAE